MTITQNHFNVLGFMLSNPHNMVYPHTYNNLNELSKRHFIKQLPTSHFIITHKGKIAYLKYLYNIKSLGKRSEYIANLLLAQGSTTIKEVSKNLNVLKDNVRNVVYRNQDKFKFENSTITLQTEFKKDYVSFLRSKLKIL